MGGDVMTEGRPPRQPPAFAIRAVQWLHSKLTGLANKLLPPEVRVMMMAGGAMQSQALHAAAKLRLPDLVAEGVDSIDDLARATGTHRDSLYRLMRALASVGVFEEDGHGRFKSTPLAEKICSDRPDSVRLLALLIGHSSWRDPWGNILHSIETGESAFEHVFGKKYFEYLDDHPDTADVFNQWMSQVSRMSAPAIVGNYDFSGFRKIVDIGGGQGVLLASILRANDHLSGVLFDLPDVVQSADGRHDQLADRLEIVGGDFFESVPAGGDLYIMQQIIHDWDDDLATKILQSCCEAMPDDGRLLAIDAVMEPGNKEDFNKFIDVHMMLLNHGGKERTEAEFRALFEAAGLELTRVIKTASMFSIVEGKKRAQDETRAAA
jgi:hypothetical protein